MSPNVPLIQLSAYEDIAEISARIERYAGRSASQKTIDKILTSIDLLATTPYLGPLHHDDVLARLGYRKLVVGKYVVVYRVDDERATVLRVFNGKSDYTVRLEE